MKYEVFNHFNHGVIDDFNQVIEFYLSPQPKENLQELTEIKNLNGANIFLYLVFSAEYKGLTELFYYHLYGRALTNLLNMLRICLEKIPPYVNGDEFIPSQLRKMNVSLCRNYRI